MITKVIDHITFDLKKDFDFSFISEFGEVFTVFDKQDSGNLCFGVQDGDRKLFLKMAGAATVKSRITEDSAISRIKATTRIYEDLCHPKLIELIDHKEIYNGYLLVFPWFEGECMGRQYTSFDKFIALPTNEKLNIYNDILLFHQHVNKCNYVAIDFYDGCIMYDFVKQQTMICDIEFYHKMPYINPIGRMWGSSQHISAAATSGSRNAESADHPSVGCAFLSIQRPGRKYLEFPQLTKRETPPYIYLE